jgi:hypothetical protein
MLTNRLWIPHTWDRLNACVYGSETRTTLAKNRLNLSSVKARNLRHSAATPRVGPCSAVMVPS